MSFVGPVSKLGVDRVCLVNGTSPSLVQWHMGDRLRSKSQSSGPVNVMNTNEVIILEKKQTSKSQPRQFVRTKITRVRIKTKTSKLIQSTLVC